MDVEQEAKVVQTGHAEVGTRARGQVGVELPTGTMTSPRSLRGLVVERKDVL